MHVLRIPPRLVARLGDDESQELAAMLDNVVTLSADRFGQALAIETGKLRAEFRQEMLQFRAEMRQELTETRAALREDMAALRVEVLRWSFLFWLGQIAAVSGLLSYLR